MTNRCWMNSLSRLALLEDLVQQSLVLLWKLRLPHCLSHRTTDVGACNLGTVCCVPTVPIGLALIHRQLIPMAELAALSFYSTSHVRVHCLCESHNRFDPTEQKAWYHRRVSRLPNPSLATPSKLVFCHYHHELQSHFLTKPKTIQQDSVDEVLELPRRQLSVHVHAVVVLW